MAGTDSEADHIRAWSETPEGFKATSAILDRMVFDADAPVYTGADVRNEIVQAYRSRVFLTGSDRASMREWCSTNAVRRTHPDALTEGDPVTHIAGFVPVLLDDINRLHESIDRGMAPHPLLTSPDLPPLPWSSPADRQPWPEDAGFYGNILDANGVPVLSPRNWRENCAAIQYLVAMANRGARVILE
jgi:hypothetical protein